MILLRLKLVNRMDSIYKDVYQYCEKHTSGPDDVLYQLERETYLKVLSPQMISGRVQGKFLELFSKIMAPENILEIGTFTGYASICLAKGLSKDGFLHTIEVNPELEWIAKKYFEKSGLSKKIKHYINDARELIPNLNIEFDLVFIDAAKLENDLYYEMVLPKLKTGGILMVDNVLWSGKVLRNESDLATQNIMKFNQKLTTDKRVEVMMLPLRDGLSLIRKI